MSKFKVGDKVFDIRHGWGHIICVDDNEDNIYPITASFPNWGAGISYTDKGRNYRQDLNPALMTVEEAAAHNFFPPKNKVKKQIKQWMNINAGMPTYCYDSKEKADNSATSYRIACVELTGEYEVEEE